MGRLQLVLSVFAVASCAVFFYFVFNVLPNMLKSGRYVMTLLDGMLITGDGLGDYVHGIDGVYIGVETAWRYALIDLSGYSTGEPLFKRTVYIRFGDAIWKDLKLKPVDPMLLSDRYCISITVLIPENTTLISPTQMSIGVPYEPSVSIGVLKAGTGEPICDIERTPIERQIGFGTRILNLTAPTPPPELYKDGYLYFTRTSNKTWVLEGDAWFLILQGLSKNETPEYEVLEYYVKLNFKITIHYEEY